MNLNFSGPYNMPYRQIKWYEYIMWTLIGAVSAFVLTLIFNFLHLTQEASFSEASDNLFGVSSSLAVIIVIYCIATPLLEELLFRYFIYNFVLKYVKRAAASIIITAALFGIYHINPVQMLYGFLMGLVITYSYHKYHVLTIPFLVHAAANAVAIGFTFI